MLDRKEEKLENVTKIQNLILEYTESVGSSKNYSPADDKCPVLDDRLPTISFLQHVTRGKESSAEAMLIQNPELIFKKDFVTDYSGRKFQNISGFQYAAWSYDINMLRMMLNHISKDQKKIASEQLEELEVKKTEHGAHYDFVPLLEALVTYTTNKDQHRNSHYWRTVIGNEQKFVPAHVANEYCQTNRIITSTCMLEPRFKNRKLKRTMKCGNFRTAHLYEWFPLSRNPGLGREYAITISRNEWPGAVQRHQYPDAADMADQKAGYGLLDLAFLSVLFKVRVSEYEEIKADLQTKQPVKQNDNLLFKFFGQSNVRYEAEWNSKHDKIFREISRLI